MKNGGAEVRLIRNDKMAAGDEDYRGTILRHARMVADKDEPGSELISCVTIGLFSDGSASVGFRYDPKTCPVPRSLFPTWVAEILRRDMVTDDQARDVFNEMFEWRDG